MQYAISQILSILFGVVLLKNCIKNNNQGIVHHQHSASNFHHLHGQAIWYLRGQGWIDIWTYLKQWHITLVLFEKPHLRKKAKLAIKQGSGAFNQHQIYVINQLRYTDRRVFIVTQLYIQRQPPTPSPGKIFLAYPCI